LFGSSTDETVRTPFTCIQEHLQSGTKEIREETVDSGSKTGHTDLEDLFGNDGTEKATILAGEE
jgi:hypothetical protein